MSTSEVTPQAALGRLVTLVSSVADPDFAGRVRRVYESASKAIGKLGEIEVGKYIEMSETGTPDLSVWEQVAPIIRDMLIEVNMLLTTVGEMFPQEAEAEGGLAGMIGEMLGEAVRDDPAEADRQRRQKEARGYIREQALLIAGEITNLGERMRSPQVVSDRWNLLSDLQEYRGKFRAAVGDLIYLSASAFAEVTRVDVVPGWAEEIKESLASRRVVTDLARVLGAYYIRMRDAAPTDFSSRLAELTRDLDAFGRSRAFVLLRVPDKRRFVEFRSLLSRLDQSPDRSAAVRALGEFVQFARGLSHINRRAALVEHDREIIAACGVLLEMAISASRERPAEAARCLADAARTAADLYGRDPKLDGWLRKSRQRDFGQLRGAELDEEFELLRDLLAGAAAR